MSDGWKIEIGGMPPKWFQEATDRGLIEPVPGESGGVSGWAKDGVRIVATGRIIPVGETISPEDIA